MEGWSKIGELAGLTSWGFELGPQSWDLLQGTGEMLKDADVRGRWPSPRWPLGPSRPGFTPSAPCCSWTPRLWPGLGPRATCLGSRKASQPGPTHNCPPESVAWAAQGPPAALGDLRGWVSEAQPSDSASKGGDCDDQVGPALTGVSQRCSAQALSPF